MFKPYLSALMGAMVSSVCIAAAGPTTAPTTMPASAEVRNLIVQLGDPDPAVRETAAVKLKQMGKPALPALREASKSEDPETSAAATGLIKRIEKRIPDAAPQNGLARASSMRVSTINGQRTVDIDADGRKIHIDEGPDGIRMTVTGVEDGKEAAVEFKAKTAEDLKKDEPEAYDLYQRYYGRLGGGNGPGIIIQGRNHAVGGGVDIQIDQIPIDVAKLRQDIEQRVREAQERAEQLKQQAQQRVNDQQQKLRDQLQQMHQDRDKIQDQLQERLQDLDGRLREIQGDFQHAVEKAISTTRPAIEDIRREVRELQQSLRGENQPPSQRDKK